MKNKKIAILSALLFFAPVTTCITACSGDVTQEAKELVKIELTQNPTKLEYEVGEMLDLTGMVVTATYSDGTTEDVTSKCSTNKDGVALTETDRIFYVKYTYEGKTKTVLVNITMKVDPVLEVKIHEISKFSDLLLPWDVIENEVADFKFWTYYDSTTLKCDGALLLTKQNDEQGTFKFVELNEILFNPETNINEFKGGYILGTYTIKEDQIKLATTDVYKTINVDTGESIHETTKYDAAQYEIGKIIKKDNEIVGIQMGELLKSSDTFFGWGKTKESAFVENISTQFGYELTQVYFDVVKNNHRSSTQKSYWAPKHADSIEVNKAPNKTAYYVGETVSTAGLELKVNYTDGTNSIVTEGYIIDKTEPLALGDSVVTVTYMSKTTTFNITVEPAPVTKYLESLEITDAPKTLLYSPIGEKPTMDALVKKYGKSMVVKAIYSDGTAQDITDYTIDGNYADPTGEVPTVSASYDIKYSHEGRDVQETIQDVAIKYYNPMDVVKTSDADLVFFTYFTKSSNKVNASLELTYNEGSTTEGKFAYVAYSTSTKAVFLEGKFAINDLTITFNEANIMIPLKGTSMFTAEEETGTLVKNANDIVGIDFGTFDVAGLFGYSFTKLGDLKANIADLYYPADNGSSANAYMHLASKVDFENETVKANIYYNANI